MEGVELDQCRGLCYEIKHLEEKIKKMSREVSVAKDSSPHFPYLEGRSRVEGPDKEEKALRKVLYQGRARCLEMKHRIYHFIDGMADPRARLAFGLGHIDGWSWQKMSAHVGSLHESYAWKIHDRYFGKK